MEKVRAYLPSAEFQKKLGLLVLIVIVCFGVYILGNYIAAHQSEKASVAKKATPILLKDVISMENGPTGVPDWVTQLGGSATVNSDGTVAAPLNDTQQFAQDLFNTTASLSEAGPISQDGANTIASQVTDQIANAQTGGETFTKSDIKIIADSQKNITAYTASVKKLVDVTYPLDIDDSISVLQNALSSGNQSGLTDLGPISDRYAKLIAAFKVLPVPSSLAETHLAFLNLMGKIHGSIQTMQNTFTNPVLTMSVFVNYPAMINDLIGYLTPFTSKLPYSTVASDANTAALKASNDAAYSASSALSNGSGN